MNENQETKCKGCAKIERIFVRYLTSDSTLKIDCSDCGETYNRIGDDGIPVNEVVGVKIEVCEEDEEEEVSSFPKYSLFKLNHLGEKIFIFASNDLNKVKAKAWDKWTTYNRTDLKIEEEVVMCDFHNVPMERCESTSSMRCYTKKQTSS